jgi:quercetin dioxygenase-like cupin family protein
VNHDIISSHKLLQRPIISLVGYSIDQCCRACSIKESTMPVLTRTLTTGRRLDGAGQPLDGTGFEYDADGPVAALLARRTSPIFSQPQTGEWVFGLVGSQESGGEYARGVGVFRQGNAGPAEHFHPLYDEHFEVLQGEFLFTVAGAERTLHAGDKLVIKKDVAHAFRCTGGGFGAVLTESRPAARIAEVITTLFGMAHEGKLAPAGQPKLLQAMAIGSEFANDTVFTSPPPAIVIPVAKALAPLARAFGYRATYAHYQADAFWNQRVEQPQGTSR